MKTARYQIRLLFFVCLQLLYLSYGSSRLWRIFPVLLKPKLIFMTSHWNISLLFFVRWKRITVWLAHVFSLGSLSRIIIRMQMYPEVERTSVRSCEEAVSTLLETNGRTHANMRLPIVRERALFEWSEASSWLWCFLLALTALDMDTRAVFLPVPPATVDGRGMHSWFVTHTQLFYKWFENALKLGLTHD